MIKRIFLGLLLVVLAVLTIPPLRHRAQPRIDDTRESLGQKLEGPLSPVLNPYRKLKTESEIGEVVRILIRDRNTGYARPSPDGFTAYMREHIQGEDGLDGWGSPYIMLPEPDSMAIVSAGPDLEYRTDDDIEVKIRYGAPDANSMRR